VYSGTESMGDSQMGDLSIEEAKEIIGSLVDSLEMVLVLAAAQKVILKLQGKRDWEAQVQTARGCK
jgi:hypothetical protein